MQSADVLIIGSGIAAFSVAQRICKEKNVILITKNTKYHNNSNLAQGGIAAAVAATDHWTSHYNDTLVAGCHYNNQDAVSYLVQHAPEEMERLIKEGMEFDKNENGLSLGKEGAHSTNRIMHAGGDATGMHLLQHVISQVKKHVTVVEHEMVLDLILQDGVCVGVTTRDDNHVTKTYYANQTVLATGGIGSLYSFTSNDETISGDGLAMAYRAGVKLVDLEFIQFHPTMLYINNRCCGLVSEAVRGEGAVLVNSKGEHFMQSVHPQADLAPRDVVARAIHKQVLNGENVYLDISMIPHFSSRFPTITSLCEENGLSLTSKRIPVVPGAHFHMGGIQTNLDGETSIKGLYAVGEVACNGVHGANRLASNSLLEGIVFGKRLGEFLLKQKDELPKRVELPINRVQTGVDLPSMKEIQDMMMSYVGIVRTEEGLEHMKEWLKPFQNITLDDTLTNEQITLINMLTVSWLITNAAQKRKESLGGHFRSDFPNADQKHTPTIISKNNAVLQLT